MTNGRSLPASPQGLLKTAEGNPVTVFVEDIGRTGFSGLLAEADAADEASRRSTQASRGAEGPGTRNPVPSYGPEEPERRAAIASFCAWLDDQREALAS